MPVTWPDVVIIAPDLSTVPAPAQAVFLASAAAVMSASTWGTRYDEGWKYLAAHLGTLYLEGALAGAGQVQSETVGQVTRTYSIAQATAGDGLDLTWYGQHYKMLIRTLVKARMFLVI